MTVRSASFGGSNWASGNSLTAADLNDTFKAVATTINTTTNSLLNTINTGILDPKYEISFTTINQTSATPSPLYLHGQINKLNLSVNSADSNLGVELISSKDPTYISGYTTESGCYSHSFDGNNIVKSEYLGSATTRNMVTYIGDTSTVSTSFVMKTSFNDFIIINGLYYTVNGLQMKSYSLSGGTTTLVQTLVAGSGWDNVFGIAFDGTNIYVCGVDSNKAKINKFVGTTTNVALTVESTVSGNYRKIEYSNGKLYCSAGTSTVYVHDAATLKYLYSITVPGVTSNASNNYRIKGEYMYFSNITEHNFNKLYAEVNTTINLSVGNNVVDIDASDYTKLIINVTSGTIIQGRLSSSE